MSAKVFRKHENKAKHFRGTLERLLGNLSSDLQDPIGSVDLLEIVKRDPTAKTLNGGEVVPEARNGESEKRKRLKARYVSYRNTLVGRGPTSPGPPKNPQVTENPNTSAQKIMRNPQPAAESAKRP